MTREARNPALPHQTFALPPRGTLARRVRDMAALWLVFGALVGVGSAPTGGGAVAIVSFMIAGMMVLPLLGVVLGLLGGGVKEACIGGLCGGVVGVAVGWACGARNPLLGANLGLINGGMVGATFATVFRLANWLTNAPLTLWAGRPQGEVAARDGKGGTQLGGR
jgi:hypothetical protein